MDFRFGDWRRELEQAIARGEPIPIRVLLDEAEREFAAMDAALQAAPDEGEPE